MTVQYTRPALIAADKLVSCHAGSIDSIAHAIVIANTEYTIDMMLFDELGMYNDKAVIDRTLTPDVDFLTERVNEIFDELRKEVIARITNSKISVNVKTLHYKESDGALDDIVCNVSME